MPMLLNPPDEYANSLPADLYQRIIESSNDIVIITKAENLEGPGPEIVYVNDVFENLTGYNRSEVIGQSPRILQGPGTDRDTRQRIRSALMRNTACTETILNYSKSGQPYWLEMNIIPLKDAKGNVTHFASIERDVTDTIDREQHLSASVKKYDYLRTKFEKIVREKEKEIRGSIHKEQISEDFSALTKIPNTKRVIWSTRILFCFLAFTTAMLCTLNFAFNQHTIRIATAQEGQNLVSALEQHADNVLASIFRLSRRAAYHQNNYFNEWQEDALNYIVHYDGLDSALYLEANG